MDYVIQFVYLAISAGIGWLVGYQTGWLLSEAKIDHSKQASLRSVKDACEGMRDFINEMDDFVDQLREKNDKQDLDRAARSRAGE